MDAMERNTVKYKNTEKQLAHISRKLGEITTTVLAHTKLMKSTIESCRLIYGKHKEVKRKVAQNDTFFDFIIRRQGWTEDYQTHHQTLYANTTSLGEENDIEKDKDTDTFLHDLPTVDTFVPDIE